MTLDFSRSRLQPFKHQVEDVAWLIERPWALIASEMRTGKTKIVIDAAQFLMEMGRVNKVIVVTPAPVRDVWADPTLGELTKHLWLDMPARVIEFHTKIRIWEHGPKKPEQLQWYVTNFEFMRGNYGALTAVCGPRTLLVLDESSFVKNWAAAQTKACYRLRKACGRVVLLNGTPVFHSPLDLFSQGNLLHPSVLDCRYVTTFKARYAIQEVVRGVRGTPLLTPHGRAIMTIASWTNLDDLRRRFTPITVRRLQADCLDLPPKLDSVPLTVALTPKTWQIYKSMRDELVVWLNDNTVATSVTAAVKAMRLSQITGGFIGGVEGAQTEEPSFLEEEPLPPPVESNVEIGHEKLGVLLWFIEQRLEADPNMKIVAWGRFRAEVLRAEKAVRERFPQLETAVVMGRQKRSERLRALALLKPETAPAGPVFVAGIEGTGSFGLDMTASHTCVTMSSGYSPGRSAQTLDRVYGPAQRHPIAYFSILATGPQGQRTIDHVIEEARRTGTDIATWTAAAWIKALSD